MPFLRFLAAFLVYTIIDIGWNVSPMARGMYERLHESAGTDRLLDLYGKEIHTWAAPELLALLAFLTLIAWANSRLAIEPAVQEKNLGKAMRNSFFLGCAAYATYIVPIFLMIDSWPGVLVPIDILIGGLLSLMTSTVVTWWALRKSAA